jgi:hypothetical protein
MACNGHNHRKECNCDFRGGHSGNRYRPRQWGPHTIKWYTSGPKAKCPDCGASVYFFKGGGTYFDCLGPPWKKHPCTSVPKEYSPFNKRGQPKLRNRLSTYERDGWIPFAIRRIEQLATGTIVHGVAFEDPVTRYLGFLPAFEPDPARPIFFRKVPDISGRIEFNCFQNGADEPTTNFAFDDCRSEMDLVWKKAL